MINKLNKKKIMIAPSILAADFSQIGDEVEAVANGGADLIHIDVMDGMFVPNITFGPKMVHDIKRHTNLPLDVHLMINNPQAYIERFAESGSDILTVHYEACADKTAEILSKIGELGLKKGVAINPDVSLTNIEQIIEKADLVLLMSVFPGFGGQKFISSVLEKIAACKDFIFKNNLKTLIEVDGGINQSNSADIISAGADILVAGSAVFGTNNYHTAISELRANK